MKFKVGDKVRIRSDLRFGQEFKYCYVNAQMLKYRGKNAEIVKIYPNGIYNINLDGKSWLWTEEMLKPVKPVGKFFKKLPNDYTGIIEVEKGYIVEKEILDEKEKEYLSAIIRPFKDRIIGITKKEYYGNDCYINIDLNNETISLPYFEKGTMYKGMELNKEYTLKELGLDE